MYKKIIWLVLFVFTLTFASISHAEIRTYEGIGEYEMSDDEAMDFAKHQATITAERNIAEQVYVYVKNESETRNGVLMHDEIIVISLSIMRVIEVNHEILPTKDDTFLVRSKVKATIDTDEIDKLIERVESE